jgi:nitrogenase iron protein NifH
MAAEQVVLVGKDGVGKSTVAANLGAALAETGKKVVLISYDWHFLTHFSAGSVREPKPVPGWDGEPGPHYVEGHLGMLFIRTGGTLTRAAVDRLLKSPLLAEFAPDYILHDLPWETAGAPGQIPLAGVASLLLVTSAEMGALRVANEVFGWLNTVFAANFRFAGVVANNLTGQLQESIINDFVSLSGTSLVANVPHSLMVTVADLYNRTLIESAPSSHISYAYRRLGRVILETLPSRRPKHLDPEALQNWGQKWGEVIVELETGIVANGAGI